jgi:hypothetical protein
VEGQLQGHVPRQQLAPLPASFAAAADAASAVTAAIAPAGTPNPLNVADACQHEVIGPAASVAAAVWLVWSGVRVELCPCAAQPTSPIHCCTPGLPMHCTAPWSCGRAGRRAGGRACVFGVVPRRCTALLAYP